MNNPNFSPEVIEYMMLNGYKQQPSENELGVLTFTRGDIVVQFWNDRIERRIISNLMKSFKGFDGKDMFKLMMILHLLDAVDLKEVKKRADTEEGKLFRELVDDLLSTMVVA